MKPGLGLLITTKSDDDEDELSEESTEYDMHVETLRKALDISPKQAKMVAKAICGLIEEKEAMADVDDDEEEDGEDEDKPKSLSDLFKSKSKSKY